MRWLVYLVAALVMELLALLLAPVLPLFARDGFLPVWLRWFETYDCNLYGDHGWQTEHVADPKAYWSQVRWLARNRAYTFKWTVLSAPMVLEDLTYEGDLKVNRNNGRFGLLRVRMGRYWQWKLVRPIGLGYCVMLNFGWLLNDFGQANALFLFSPRVARVKQGDGNGTGRQV